MAALIVAKKYVIGGVEARLTCDLVVNSLVINEGGKERELTPEEIKCFANGYCLTILRTNAD